jgi:hypothetical protein
VYSVRPTPVPAGVWLVFGALPASCDGDRNQRIPEGCAVANQRSDEGWTFFNSVLRIRDHVSAAKEAGYSESRKRDCGYGPQLNSKVATCDEDVAEDGVSSANVQPITAIFASGCIVPFLPTMHPEVSESMRSMKANWWLCAFLVLADTHLQLLLLK